MTAGLQFFGGGELKVYEWDTLYLAGERWPGICSISGKGIARRLDQKKSKGSDGATLKDNGNDLAEWTIELLIYNPTDWEDLQRLLPLVSPRRAGGPRQPLAIVYPSLSLLGISSCYVKAVSVPNIDKKSQQLTVTMAAIEWVPKPRKVKKGAGTRRGKGVNDPNNPSEYWQNIEQEDANALDGQSREEDRAIHAAREAAQNSNAEAEELRDPATVSYGPIISGKAEDNTF